MYFHSKTLFPFNPITFLYDSGFKWMSEMITLGSCSPTPAPSAFMVKVQWLSDCS